MRLVALEEHYATPDLLEATGLDVSWIPGNPHDRLLGTAEQRLADMDAAGIDRQVLSAVGPAVQQLPDPVAIALARRLNDHLDQRFVAPRRDRFAAFATLPTGNPAAATRELERVVTDLGFVGALVNGTTADRFLDHPDYAELLAAAAGLGVPLYLHPGGPPLQVGSAYYTGVDPLVGRMLATAGYGWHYETSLHALRLIVAGVFDRNPDLQIILGHLGEGLPFHVGRLDDMLTPLTAGYLARPIPRYLRENFWITTSGYFFDGPFRLAHDVFGEDRVMFSVDYPFSDNVRAAQWFADVDVSDQARHKIAHRNADRLLGLR